MFVNAFKTRSIRKIKREFLHGSRRLHFVYLVIKWPWGESDLLKKATLLCKYYWISLVHCCTFKVHSYTEREKKVPCFFSIIYKTSWFYIYSTDSSQIYHVTLRSELLLLKLLLFIFYIFIWNLNIESSRELKFLKKNNLVKIPAEAKTITDKHTTALRYFIFVGFIFFHRLVFFIFYTNKKFILNYAQHLFLR